MRESVYFEGLIFGCTVYNANCRDCPFIEIWKLPVEQRVELMQNLDLNSKSVILEKHFKNFKK